MATKEFKFGKRSKGNLEECHPLIQEIFNEVIKIIDCSIIEGHRSKEEQDKLFHKGFSKLQYPNSKHNKSPSFAVDAVPFPIDWKDKERFCLFAGIVKGVAHSKGVEIRWGGDWDMDNTISDESFVDMPHFELIGVDK